MVRQEEGYNIKKKQYMSTKRTTTKRVTKSSTLKSKSKSMSRTTATAKRKVVSKKKVVAKKPLVKRKPVAKKVVSKKPLVKKVATKKVNDFTVGFTNEIYKPITALVSIENTSNRGGGSCYDINDLQAIKEICLPIIRR